MDLCEDPISAANLELTRSRGDSNPTSSPRIGRPSYHLKGVMTNNRGTFYTVKYNKATKWQVLHVKDLRPLSTKMTSTAKPTTLPPNKRYILGHDEAGKSIILPSPDQIYHGREGTGGLARSYAVSSVPAVLADDADVKLYMEPDPKKSVTSHLATDIVVSNQKGAAILVIDLAPGGESQMHQTVSIDFSICVAGDINMELDGGEMIHLKPGVSALTCLGCR